MPPGFDPSAFDPSKMDPQLISELSALMMTLPPDQMMKLQGLIHNSMAGFDVTKEMLEFEQSLPPGFRERMARVLARANGVGPGPTPSNGPVGHSASAGTTSEPQILPSENPVRSTQPPRDIHEARKVILRGVASGSVSPEEALGLLFPDE